MNRYLNLLGLGVMLVSAQAFAATTWDPENNRVTYSAFQDGISLNGLVSSVSLSQLNLSEVAQNEKVGTAANYVLTSVVLSMNGSVYGTFYCKNNSDTSVSPIFKIIPGSASRLTFGSSLTPEETYSYSQPIGTLAAGAEYSSSVSIPGATSPQTVTITSDLQQFLGTQTIGTSVSFNVDPYFQAGGSQLETSWNLSGAADVAVTYNYEYVASAPEPTSMALIALGCAALGLRRKRMLTA